MKRSAMVIGIVAALVVFASAVPASAEPMDAGKAFTKLTRGFINIVTGWVEVPKRIHETSQESGAAAGFTWGLLRGMGHGFIRTAAGFYELFTFPFPAPPGYESVIQPEYVFTEEETGSSEYK
jgi:putative exosortase-associated protein (TIGR04073 family)